MQNKVKRIPVTIEGFEKLKQELAGLKEQRPQAVKTLAEARSMGDLSENGLYTAAKARLRSIDNQIFRVEMQIKLADIADTEESGKVGIGSKVEVLKDREKLIFHIVGDYEADPRSKKISQHAPLGKALMGREKGDTVMFRAPDGEVEYKILRIF